MRVRCKKSLAKLILARGHVRAGAGDLPRRFNSVRVSVRYQTPFSSRHESGPSLFLLTGKHPVVGQLPPVSFPALPGQSSDRPNLPPHQNTFDFSVSFRQYSENTPEACKRLRKRRIDRSTSKRSSTKLQRAATTPSFSTGPSSSCIVELQRMFEHSNIIRLRFSRTNFFYERTFVDARWSVFGAHVAERSFRRGLGLARGSHARMALLLKSCVDACQCHVPEISRERSGNMNIQLEEKRERQSF